jgi:hypothetical protein
MQMAPSSQSVLSNDLMLNNKQFWQDVFSVINHLATPAAAPGENFFRAQKRKRRIISPSLSLFFFLTDLVTRIELHNCVKEKTSFWGVYLAGKLLNSESLCSFVIPSTRRRLQTKIVETTPLIHNVKKRKDWT